MMNSLNDVESLCTRLYTTTDSQSRLETQSILDQLFNGDSNHNGSLYTSILQQSANQYALMYCAQSVVVWFKTLEKSFSMATKEEVVMTVVQSVRRLKGAQAPKHIISAIMTSAAKITKLGCEKEPLLLCGVHEALRMVQSSLLAFQNGTATVGTNADGSGGGPSSSTTPTTSDDFVLGLQMLNAFTTEFNLYDSSKQQTYMGFAVHRRCSSNFKDSALMALFLSSMACLEAINPAESNAMLANFTSGGAAVSPSPSPSPAAFTTEIVLLVKNILTYDFMAIIVDETEDAMSSQFPASWKDALLSERCLQVLWGQHNALQYPHCATLLAALGSLCSTRRSFFDTVEEKMGFLAYCMDQIAAVESLTDGRLKIPHYCAVMAECISRFVAPFGYKDLAASPSFERWIGFAQSLSRTLLTMRFGEDGSFAATTTMLQFWGRISNSKRMYLGDEDRRRDIEDVVPALAVQFLTNRVTPVLNSSMELDEEMAESVQSQADLFPALVLLEPAKTLDQMHVELQRIGPSVLTTPASLGWLLYLAGSVVRSVFPSVEEACADSCSYFLLFAVECANRRRTDPAAVGCFHDFVEEAMLHFLSALQATFTSSRLSTAITRIVTNVFEEKAKLFHFILYAVGHNITRDPTNTATGAGDALRIVRNSIDVVSDACRDVPVAVMRELKMDLPPVVSLPMSQYVTTFKLRTNLQCALWQLKPSGENYQPNVLTEFLQPIEELMRQTSHHGCRDPLFVGGWLRDLRGVSRGTANNQNCFADFVDWIIDKTPYFVDVLQIQPMSPLIFVSLLRLLSELVTTSRYGKVNLPTSSHCASGIMLFKFICQVVQETLAVTITDDQLGCLSSGTIPDGAYTYLLKPLWLSMDIMRKCLHGDFVPFGAMHHYKDDVFDVTVVGMFRMLTVFPPSLFRQYPKASYAVLDLLRSMTELQVISPLANMSSEELSRLIQFAIFMCSDVETSTAGLLHGLSFLSFIAQLVGSVKAIVLNTPPSMSPADLARGGGIGSGSNKGPRGSRRLREAIARTLAPHQDLWTTLIHTAMSVIVCQDRALSVCCSVIYPIYEADPSFWYQFAQEFVQTYPQRKQVAVQEALSDLVRGGGESQERFFSEIFIFRNKMRSI